jgi:hypothetical protein
MPGDKIAQSIISPEEIQIENQPTEKDMWMKEVSNQIFSMENIEIKTDLNVAQINALTKGKLFAKHFNCTIMDDLCNTIMTLSVSKNRGSRKEFVDISKNMHPDNNEMQPTLKTRLLG